MNAYHEIYNIREQLRYFKFDKSNINGLSGYLNAVSMFISMYIFNNTGNTFPHMSNENEYILNEEEIIFLNQILELNRKFITAIENEGYYHAPPKHLKHNINTNTKYYGLDEFDSFLAKLSAITLEYNENIIVDEEQDLLNRFLKEFMIILIKKATLSFSGVVF